MTGLGRESQGFYHLSIHILIFKDASFLNHNRLGHPSVSKFQKMVPHFSLCHYLLVSPISLGNMLMSRFQSV